MMERQPVGTKRSREDADDKREDRARLKREDEDQDDVPAKKLVGHLSMRSA